MIKEIEIPTLHMYVNGDIKQISYVGVADKEKHSRSSLPSF